MLYNNNLNEILSKREKLYDLIKVKNYLKKQPLSSILEVNEKTGVSIGEILNFVKVGLIKIKEGNKMTFISKKKVKVVSENSDIFNK